jgi:hypothetical protein
MAAKKKTGKKHARRKQAAAKNAKRVTKTIRKKPAKKKASLKKKMARKKSSLKAAAKAKSARPVRKSSSRRRQVLPSRGFKDQGLGSGSAGQSGDLQGLSNVERADSESVDELIEEGNAFEAEVVAGVESAEDEDEQEVHTHEVPEDDVPEEYLDQE